MKAIIVILIVLAVVIGGILTLRSTRNLGMPDSDTLDRAKRREPEQSSKDDQK